MDKNKYLELRSILMGGHVNDEILRLFYDYWIEFKKEEYKGIDFEEFKATFPTYLSQGFNFADAANLIMAYYDKNIGITYLKDKAGNLIKIL